MVRQRRGGATEVDADAVLAWARDRARRGVTLRTVELIADPDPAVRAMVGAARRHFGTWRAMLAAAGLESPRRGRTAPPQPAAAEVLAWVRALAAAGTPLKSGWLGAGPDPTPRRMLAAGRVHFGSWARTLAAAGVEAARERPGADAVVAWLQGVVAQRGAVPRSPLELRRDESSPAMVAAARHHFGSWYGLLVAAGFAEAPPREAPPSADGVGAAAVAGASSSPPPRARPALERAPSPAPVARPPAAPPPPPAAASPSTPAQVTRRWLGAEVVLSPLPFAARWAGFEAEVAAALADERRVPPGLVVMLTEAVQTNQLALIQRNLAAVLALLERHAELLELSAPDARHHALAALLGALAARGVPVPERLAGLAQAWAAPASRRRRRRR